MSERAYDAADGPMKYAAEALNPSPYQEAMARIAELEQALKLEWDKGYIKGIRYAMAFQRSLRKK